VRTSCVQFVYMCAHAACTCCMCACVCTAEALGFYGLSMAPRGHLGRASKQASVCVNLVQAASKLQCELHNSVQPARTAGVAGDAGVRLKWGLDPNSASGRPMRVLCRHAQNCQTDPG